MRSPSSSLRWLSTGKSENKWLTLERNVKCVCVPSAALGLAKVCTHLHIQNGCMSMPPGLAKALLMCTSRFEGKSEILSALQSREGILPNELNIHVRNWIEMITIGSHAFIRWLLGSVLYHNVYANEIQRPSIIICKCGGFDLNINVMHKTTCNPMNGSVNTDTVRDLRWAVIQWPVPNYHLHQPHSGDTALHNARTMTTFGKKHWCWSKWKVYNC